MIFRTQNSELSSQKGTALIIAILIVTILSSLAVEFAYEVYVDTAALSNWENAQRASLAARSGQTLSTEYLKTITALSYTYPDEMLLTIEHDFGSDTQLTVLIQDENSKFNINSIIYPNGLTNEDAYDSLKKLLKYLNINSALAMNIADWIDPDQEPKTKDSEYNVKNSEMWTVEELLLVEGIDDNIFKTLSPYITVHSDEKININSAKLPVLFSLHQDMTENLAQKIIDYRESSPFEDETDLQRVSGMETIGQAVLGSIAVKGSYFRVVSQATVNDITRVTESVMDNSMKVEYWREG